MNIEGSQLGDLIPKVQPLQDYRTYRKVMYSNLTPDGIKTPLDALINPICDSALRHFIIKEMTMVKRFKQNIEPKAYYTIIYFTIGGNFLISKRTFNFWDGYAEKFYDFDMEGTGEDGRELKTAIRETVEAIRYVRGEGITDLMPIIRERIKLEDEATERANQLKEIEKAAKLQQKEEEKQRKSEQKAAEKLKKLREKEQRKAAEEKRKEEEREQKEKRKRGIMKLGRPKKIVQKNEEELEGCKGVQRTLLEFIKPIQNQSQQEEAS